jgi:hypothetical protein
MSIRRTRLAFEDHFTQVPNQWVRDKRLTRKARGLLVELMSHRLGWEITIESLIRDGIEGRDSIRSAIQELEDAGYLHRERERNSDGTLAGTDYVIVDPWSADEPTSDNPTQANPPTKKTITTEDHHQELSRVADHSSAIDAEFAAIWEAWPRKVGKDSAHKRWSAMSPRLRTEVTSILVEHANVYRTYPAQEKQFIPHLATWLNQKRWEDETPQTRAADGKVKPPEPKQPERFTLPPGHVRVYDEVTGQVIGTRPA